jgi:hypothetical protein
VAVLPAARRPLLQRGLLCTGLTALASMTRPEPAKASVAAAAERTLRLPADPRAVVLRWESWGGMSAEAA